MIAAKTQTQTQFEEDIREAYILARKYGGPEELVKLPTWHPTYKVITAEIKRINHELSMGHVVDYAKSVMERGWPLQSKAEFYRDSGAKSMVSTSDITDKTGEADLFNLPLTPETRKKQAVSAYNYGVECLGFRKIDLVRMEPGTDEWETLAHLADPEAIRDYAGIMLQREKN